ncbi:MAG: hypothetical protein K8R88_00110 [Armatimonadetes bacterium]|nr:hypothetical protein [Armatimonadota bacterium]
MDWIVVNREGFRNQARSFSLAITAIGNGLGLLPAEISGFAEKSTVFWEGTDELVMAKAAYESALQRSLTQQEELTAEMRTFNRRMQASPNINNGNRAQLGIPIPAQTRSVVRPVTVSELIATPYANGEVKLKWNRSGNAETIVFNIEMSEDAQSWRLIENTNRASISLSGFAPGVTKYFRIVAKRGKFKAVASTAAAIYSGSQFREESEAA